MAAKVYWRGVEKLCTLWVCNQSACKVRFAQAASQKFTSAMSQRVIYELLPPAEAQPLCLPALSLSLECVCAPEIANPQSTTCGHVIHSAGRTTKTLAGTHSRDFDRAWRTQPRNMHIYTWYDIPNSTHNWSWIGMSFPGRRAHYCDEKCADKQRLLCCTANSMAQW